MHSSLHVTCTASRKVFGPKILVLGKQQTCRSCTGNIKLNSVDTVIKYVTNVKEGTGAPVNIKGRCL